YPCPLAAASIRRNISVPAPHPFHASACKRWQSITSPAPIRSPSVAAALSPQSSAAFSAQRSWEKHPPPKPPPHQIPIDGQPLTAVPRLRSSGAFGRRPLSPVDHSQRAGIRNPSRKRARPFGRTIPLKQTSVAHNRTKGAALQLWKTSEITSDKVPLREGAITL